MEGSEGWGGDPPEIAKSLMKNFDSVTVSGFETYPSFFSLIFYEFWPEQKFRGWSGARVPGPLPPKKLSGKKSRFMKKLHSLAVSGYETYPNRFSVKFYEFWPEQMFSGWSGARFPSSPPSKNCPTKNHVS